MPKGRTKRQKRARAKRPSSIFVKWRGVIVLAGPSDREHWLRERCESKIRKSLERCPYLATSGLAERYAFKIAWGAKFQAVDKYKRGIIRIRHLDVVYQNPPVHWKWWSRWRDNRDTLVITGDEYHEDHSWL